MGTKIKGKGALLMLERDNNNQQVAVSTPRTTIV